MAHPTPTLVLVDGSSYFYRAFHALPPLSNSKGEATGAVYGVINMINKLVKDAQPDYFAVVFDTKGKTFRDDLYPLYKANRPPMPDELKRQFQPIKDIIEASGMPLIMIEGVEADDVIGTLARQAEQKQWKTIISTGDKDMAQLVSAHIECVNTMTDTVLDKQGVIDKFGVVPEQIVDYLTLIGDKVDNIPGVDKVGPKTAVKWLSQYGSLEEVMAHADDIGGKVGEHLRNALEHLHLSKQLVTIKEDVELPIELESLQIETIDQPRLINLYQQLEFRGWLKSLLEEASSEVIEKNYDVVLTESDFNRWLEKLKKAPLFAFDTETTSLDMMKAEVVGVSVCVEPGRAAYIPFGHDYLDAPKQLDKRWVLDHLKPLLEDDNIKKIGQNLKYDMNVLAREGVILQGISFDTMLESYVLNSAANRHDMDTLALKYLGVKTISYEEVAGKGAKQITFNQVALEEAGPYAAEDADITLQLHKAIWPKVSEVEGLKKTLCDIEVPLISVLSDMERTGVLIDADKLKIQSKRLAETINRLEKESYKLAGEIFNLNSPKQLIEILYTKLNLPILKKTPKGQPSTAEPVLQKLSLDYPLPAIILEYRSLSKLKSTYTDKLPKQINATTGRVHTSYNQAVASTGRLSSTDPNLQNIPVRTEEGRHIREAFIAPDGYVLLSADYSQIELRLMAHLSDDPGLKEAFANGWDVHQATASEVFGVPLDGVTPDQRRHAKAINFGLLYGMSAFGLARELKTSKSDAQAYIDRYFGRYVGVQTYMENAKSQAREFGYVETIFGRRLYLPEIHASNKMRQQAAERAAINAPLQGSAADIIKLAMIELHDSLKQSNLDAKMIMQVHDELVFEVALKDVDALRSLAEDKMCHVVELCVPMQVGIGVGRNWQEAH